MNPHDFYKPITSLIIKIFMIGIRNVKTVFTTVFTTLPSIGGNKYGKTGHSKICTLFFSTL